MGIGPVVERQIILKYRMKLKATLAEHEVKSDSNTHMILLGDLIRVVEKNLEETSGSSFKKKP